MATALNCLCGMLPTAETHQAFADLVETVEAALGCQMRLVSGGHTGDLHLLQSGATPPHINQVRVGEAILCGTDFSTCAELPMPYTDAFTVFAEVIEVMDSSRTGRALRSGCVHEGVRVARSRPASPGHRRSRRDRSEHRQPSAEARRRRDRRRQFRPPRRRCHRRIATGEAGEELEFGTLYPAVCTGWSSRCCERVVLN